MLRDQIKILSREEAELLVADKLPKKRRNSTGLYMTCEPEKYTAYEYSYRQSWIENFGKSEQTPEGFIKEFSSPLDAIDWLLN